MLNFYLWLASGLTAEELARGHESTRQRAYAFALALSIPLITWSLTAYVIASQIFQLSPGRTLVASIVCMMVVYCIERLIMISPNRWYVIVSRVFIAGVAAVIAASAVDLCLFAREIEGQIRLDAKHSLRQQHDRERADQERVVEARKADWEAAEARARCEANGTCGTVVPGPGPLWRDLSTRAVQRRDDYLKASHQLDAMKAGQALAIQALATSEAVVREAGLLARIDALARFNQAHEAAQWAYLLLFLFVAALEGACILIKASFGNILSDRIHHERERLAGHQLKVYVDEMTSPDSRGLALIHRRP
jgi:uncharacterized membrane protein YhdT